jgi:hypothetical protein
MSVPREIHQPEQIKVRHTRSNNKGHPPTSFNIPVTPREITSQTAAALQQQTRTQEQEP